MIWIQFITVLEILNYSWEMFMLKPKSFLLPDFVFDEQFTVYSFQFNIMHSTLCFSIDCRAADGNYYSRVRVAGADIVTITLLDVVTAVRL